MDIKANREIQKIALIGHYELRSELCIRREEVLYERCELLIRI
jgi:hypothetical protein